MPLHIQELVAEIAIHLDDRDLSSFISINRATASLLIYEPFWCSRLHPIVSSLKPVGVSFRQLYVETKTVDPETAVRLSRVDLLTSNELSGRLPASGLVNRCLVEGDTTVARWFLERGETPDIWGVNSVSAAGRIESLRLLAEFEIFPGRYAATIAKRREVVDWLRERRILAYDSKILLSDSQTI